MNKKICLFLIIIFFPFLMVSGFSSWILVGNKTIVLGPQPTTTAVCYNGTSNKQYTRIEKALSEANSNEVIYVKPNLGHDVIIYQDCTIKSGVTLCLPFSGTDHYSETFKPAKENEILTTVFSDNNLNNRKTLVIVEENVRIKIESNGSLLIGGEFGREGQDVIGLTCGAYCEIQMMPNSLIDSYGSIECYGFIKEYAKNNSQLNNGSKVILNEGQMKVPFTIYDFKGGTVTTNMNNSGICPFDVYDIPNVQTIFRIYASANLIGEIRINMSVVGNIIETVTIVGNTTTNTALIMKKGYVDLKYIPKTAGITSIAVDGSKTYASLYGVMEIGSIKVSKTLLGYGVTIDTNTYFFPVSFKFNFSIESGSVLNVNKKAKFMPGSEMHVKQGGTLNINEQFIFYPDDFNEVVITGSYPQGLPRAKLICDGKINIGENGSLGAYIENNVDGATLNILTSTFEVSSLDFWEPTGNVKVETLGILSPGGSYSKMYKSGFISENGYWKKTEIKYELNYVDVSYSTSSSTSSGLATLTVNEWYDEEKTTPSNTGPYTYSWSKVSGNSSLSNASSKNAVLTNGNKSIDTCYVNVTVTDSLGNSATINNVEIVVPAKEDGGGCFSSGTLVTMADGTQKPIENVKANDQILTFNHYTGQYESTKIGILVNHGYKYYDVMNLKFDDGTTLKFIEQHGLLDVETKEYVDIRLDNYKEFIGRTYLQYDPITNSNKEVILEDIYITNEYTGSYSIFSSRNMNAVTNNILSMTTGIPGLYNIFELNDDYVIDQDLMNQDIEKYGLYDYEYWKEYIPYDIYYDLSFEYLKIAYGKGLTTEAEIIANIEWYNRILEGGEIIQ